MDSDVFHIASTDQLRFLQFLNVVLAHASAAPIRRLPRSARRARDWCRYCSLVFAPGWEVDSDGGTAGLCQPVERDLFDCHLSCFWPAHVPDQLNHAHDWTGQCASAQKDWRKLDLIFP